MNERVPHGIALMLEKPIKTIEAFDLHDIIRCLLTLLFVICDFIRSCVMI